MSSYILAAEQISAFGQYLKQEEREAGTIEKYCRDVRKFAAWLHGRTVTKELVVSWKEWLKRCEYAPVTINSMLVALNQFFRFAGWDSFHIKALKLQRKIFRSTEKELTKEEYIRLVKTADALGKKRLALLMETICATGIRVSEIKYITAEALQAGRAEIRLKGKIRTILIPGKLCRKLQKFIRKEKIASGEVFRTRNGRGISRRQVWAEMKALCAQAGVAPSKVFPHNLRHLFAQTFYRIHRDMARLADVLGHSSIETTRIYLISSGAEHAQQLERLELVC